MKRQWWMKYYFNKVEGDGAAEGIVGDRDDSFSSPDVSSIFADEVEPVASKGDSDEAAWGAEDEDGEPVLPTKDSEEEKPVEEEQFEETPDVTDDEETTETPNTDGEEKDNGEESQDKEAEAEQQPQQSREEWEKGYADFYATLMDEETANELRADPEKVMPKLLAKVHANAVEQSIKIVVQSLPDQIARVTQLQAEAVKAEQEFYSAWPELKKADLNKTVMSSLQAYRNANPKASREEVIKQGGLLAIMTAKLPMPDLATRFGGAGKVAETVERAAQSGGGKAPQGLQPNQQRVSNVPPKQVQSEPNFFSDWAESFISDNDD